MPLFSFLSQKTLFRPLSFPLPQEPNKVNFKWVWDLLIYLDFRKCKNAQLFHVLLTRNAPKYSHAHTRARKIGAVRTCAEKSDNGRSAGADNNVHFALSMQKAAAKWIKRSTTTAASHASEPLALNSNYHTQFLTKKRRCCGASPLSGLNTKIRSAADNGRGGCGGGGAFPFW